MYFIYNILTDIFRQIFRSYSVWRYYYKIRILVIRTSPWRWQEYRPKHVGENTVNKIHRKYWSSFCWLVIYFGTNAQIWTVINNSVAKCAGKVSVRFGDFFFSVSKLPSKWEQSLKYCALSRTTCVTLPCLYPALHDLHSHNTKRDIPRRFVHSNTQYTNTA